MPTCTASRHQKGGCAASNRYTYPYFPDRMLRYGMDDLVRRLAFEVQDDGMSRLQAQRIVIAVLAA